MLTTKTEQAMKDALHRFITMRWYGRSFTGQWFAAKTREALFEAGVLHPKPVYRS